MLDGAAQELPLDKTFRQRFVKPSILPAAEDSTTAECTKEEPRWWWRLSQGLRVDIHCRRYDKFLGWRNFCANSYWFWYRLAPIRGSQKSSSPREWNAKSESVKRSHVLMVVTSRLWSQICTELEISRNLAIIRRKYLQEIFDLGREFTM